MYLQKNEHLGTCRKETVVMDLSFHSIDWCFSIPVHSQVLWFQILTSDFFICSLLSTEVVNLASAHSHLLVASAGTAASVHTSLILPFRRPPTSSVHGTLGFCILFSTSVFYPECFLFFIILLSRLRKGSLYAQWKKVT